MLKQAFGEHSLWQTLRYTSFTFGRMSVQDDDRPVRAVTSKTLEEKREEKCNLKSQFIFFQITLEQQ